MSVAELLENKVKPWLNIRVAGITVDNGIVYPSDTFSPTVTPQAIANNQTGAVFFLPQATASLTINLVGPFPGGRFKVYLTAVPDGVHTVTFHSTGANMSGNAVGVAAGLVAVPFAGVTNIILGATAANAKVGDWVEFISTGTGYLVQAWSSGTAAAWTTS